MLQSIQFKLGLLWPHHTTFGKRNKKFMGHGISHFWSKLRDVYTDTGLLTSYMTSKVTVITWNLHTKYELFISFCFESVCWNIQTSIGKVAQWCRVNYLPMTSASHPPRNEPIMPPGMKTAIVSAQVNWTVDSDTDPYRSVYVSL